MTRYRIKPLEVEAVQWFKNGDHPGDYEGDTTGFEKGVMRVFPGAERKARGWEGAVVRYFRHPGIDGGGVCGDCGHTMHNHGWIGKGGDGQAVCPGDWVVKVAGEHTAYTQAQFAHSFEEAP